MLIRDENGKVIGIDEFQSWWCPDCQCEVPMDHDHSRGAVTVKHRTRGGRGEVARALRPKKKR